MEDKLKNLKEKMNRSNLKEIRFDEKHKEQVFQSIKGREEDRFSIPNYKRKFNLVLSGMVSCALVFGALYYSADQIGFFNASQTGEQVSASFQTESSEAEHRDPLKNEDDLFSAPDSEKLAQENPDQFEIVKKMFFSWDHIDNAQGSYSYSSHPDGTVTNVNFQVDFERNKNLTSIEITKDEKVLEKQISLLKDDQVVLQLPEKKLVTTKSAEDNLATQHQYLNMGGHVISSEWFVLLLDNYDHWSYQENTKFGMPVYEIEGDVPEYNGSFGPFKMTVSKETGALLDAEFYKENGEVAYFMKADEVRLNEGVDPSLFHINVEDSEEVTFETFNESTIGHGVEGEKPGGFDTSKEGN
ncbi:hypothetical protein [Pseudalkalibacillus sp. SCS-8]|uniref:hypothetical protein n=1 Tax=Pseudalkalibacillus nanhaiensis TaxID=3115291 RepID=UPI0032DA24DE